jgi:hypothetical protein
VISEPPRAEQRWNQGFVDELGLTSERLGPVRLFHVKR